MNYENEDIDFIMPADIQVNSPEYEIWEKACKFSEKFYKEFLSTPGVTPQQARAVLNNSVRTKIRMTINLRSLRNMLKLRCGKAAHPDMKLIMISLLLWLKKKIPVVFDDISYDEEFVNKLGLAAEYEDYIKEV